MTCFDRLQGFRHKSLLVEAKVFSAVILHLRHPKLAFCFFPPRATYPEMLLVRQDEIEYARNDFHV